MAARIFKNTPLERFARKQSITDEDLVDAVRRVERGLIDANLGGCVFKQRVAKAGKGKSGGYRTIILYKKDHRAYLVHGFEKSGQDNLEEDEEAMFKKMAKYLLALSESEMNILIKNGKFSEILDPSEEDDGEEV